MSDMFDKVTSEQNIFEKIASKIPGFSGYMERENRRDADQLLRQEIARQYSQQLGRLNDVPAALLDAGKITLLDDLDKVRTRLQTFIDRVAMASYGYSGLFDAVKIDQPELLKLYNFDAGLLEGIGRLSLAIDAVASGETDLKAINSLVAVVDDLNSTFSQRETVIKGA